LIKECSEKTDIPLVYTIIGHGFFENGKLVGEVLEATYKTFLVKRISDNRYLNGTEQTLHFKTNNDPIKCFDWCSRGDCELAGIGCPKLKT
jgi:hypothetical protein